MTTHPAPLLFVDTETTGLDPDRHEIWEVAAIRRDPDGGETVSYWQLPVDLGRADPMALAIGRYHERRSEVGPAVAGAISTTHPLTSRSVFAAEFMSFARGCHLVGAVPSFDAERLRKLLRAHGACESWHYHLVDVEALAVGYLAGTRGTAALTPMVAPPWKSDELTAALGITVPDEDKHTALGDARWAMAIYDKVMGS